MESQLQENIRKTAEETRSNLEPQQQRATPATVANSSPVISASSSPSHEFSFTISLHSSATTTATSNPASIDKSKQQEQQQQQSQTPSLAIDLSPADEIFFHGHLLPLHFLSHLHTSSPRPSTHSLDSFALPNKHESKDRTTENSNISCNTCNEDDHCISFNKENDDESNIEINLHSCQTAKEGTNDKSKSPFSLFGLSKRKKAPTEVKEKSSEGISEHKSRKLKFDVSQFLKRYLNMVKPLLSPRGGRRDNNVRGRRQSYSFSGTVTPRDNREALMRGKRGEFSAPASMRTSPTNSGLLLGTAGVASPVSDSTMEELQAAIQAAIAHCKNSISSEDKSQQELSSVPVN